MYIILHESEKKEKCTQSTVLDTLAEIAGVHDFNEHATIFSLNLKST